MDSKSTFDRFYRFRIDDLIKPMSTAPINNSEISTAVSNKLFLGDFSVVKPEIFFQCKIGGNKLCDVISAGAPGFHLFSDKVINALKESGITGWGAYPVTVQTKKKGDLTNYYAFYVTGRAEKADRSLSGQIEVPLPNGKKKMKDKGYFFPLDSWDGSDFFYFTGTLSAIGVTERVKEVFEAVNATNAKFTHCTEFIWP